MTVSKQMLGVMESLDHMKGDPAEVGTGGFLVLLVFSKPLGHVV